MTKFRTRLVTFSALLLLGPTISHAQLITFSNQDLLDYTAQNPFGRFPNGRPKVPDDLIERARGLSAEEIWEGLEDQQLRNQYADGFQILHPGKTLVGRAFTVQFMPERSDLDRVATAKAKARGIRSSPTRLPSTCCNLAMCWSSISLARKLTEPSSATTCFTTS